MTNISPVEPAPAQAAVDFLSPESMLTPGLCGALTMMITNTLAQSFDVPRAHTGLLISALFGLIVFVATKSLIKRAIYFVLNTLVIFCVAAGANNFASGSGAQIGNKLVSFVTTAAHAGPIEAPDRVRSAADVLASECSATRSGNAGQADGGRFCVEFLKSYRANSEISTTSPVHPGTRGGESKDLNALEVKSNAFFKPWHF